MVVEDLVVVVGLHPEAVVSLFKLIGTTWHLDILELHIKISPSRKCLIYDNTNLRAADCTPLLQFWAAVDRKEADSWFPHLPTERGRHVVSYHSVDADLGGSDDAHVMSRISISRYRVDGVVDVGDVLYKRDKRDKKDSEPAKLGYYLLGSALYAPAPGSRP